MVFAGLPFLYLFLPAVLLVFSLLPVRAKNAFLLLASLLFYYIGSQRLVILLLISTFTDYFCGRLIDARRSSTLLRQLGLGLSLAVNLGMLGYFKYAGFLMRGVSALTGGEPLLQDIVLPIGISFYTFQTLSYTVDVYRGAPAERNFVDFACFVTLFPQLIAGPIVRHSDIGAELKERRVTLADAEIGIRRFCFGLGKKVLLANSLAQLAQLAVSAETTVLLAWAGAFAQALQIFFDFSGYSDMAIGIGLLLGFHFPENFDRPFAARSVSEFWQRWHITLGSWFRDYVYIPLGGSRVRDGRLVLNLLTVWAATGLWHGAQLNYLLWGLFYGALILAEKLIGRRCTAGAGTQTGRSPAKSLLSGLYMTAVSVVGFEIFCADSPADIAIRLGRLVGAGRLTLTSVYSSYTLRSHTVLLAVSLLLALLPRPDKAPGKARRILLDTLALLLLLLSTAYLVDGSYNPFLYFRF